MRHDRWSLILLALALINVVVGATVAQAQVDHTDFLQRQIDRAEHRITTLEMELRASVLTIEHRLTKLETLVESNRTLLWTVMGSIVALVAQAALGWLRMLTRQKTSSGGDA